MKLWFYFQIDTMRFFIAIFSAKIQNNLQYETNTAIFLLILHSNFKNSKQEISK